MTRVRLVVLTVVSIVCALSGVVRAGSTERTPGLPLSFAHNAGQFDPAVKFLGQGPGYTVSLTETEAILTWHSRKPSSVGDTSPELLSVETAWEATTLRIKLAPRKPAGGIVAYDRLPGVANFFIGNDPAQWRRDVATFARVQYEDIYPGIDLMLFSDAGRLALEFLVDPGVDPSVISLGFEGAERLDVDADGNLSARTSSGPVILSRPAVSQGRAGYRRQVPGAYALVGEKQASFRQDPASSAGAGGSVEVSAAEGVRMIVTLRASGPVFTTDGAVDGAGNIFGTGYTAAADFPVLSAHQSTPAGGEDWIVWSLDPTGALRWSTYLGGTAVDRATGLALGPGGSVYVVGTTASSGFPTAGTPAQPAIGSPGTNDAAVVKLSSAGVLLAGTFLGGSGDDQGLDIDVDAAGNVLLTGSTRSGSDFPRTPGAFQSTLGGAADAFVTKLDGNLSAFMYSTFLGGANFEEGRAIAAGDGILVGGLTQSPNFPIVNASQPVYGGAGDGFVTKLGSAAAGPAVAGTAAFSTYLGGDMRDMVNDVEQLADGRSAVVGETRSGLPFRPEPRPDVDGFLAVHFVSGALDYVDSIGGSDNDWANSVTIGLAGLIVGLATVSTDFPTTPDAHQTEHGSPGVGAFNFAGKWRPFGELESKLYVAIAAFDAEGDGKSDLGLLARTLGPIPQVTSSIPAPEGTALGTVFTIEGADVTDIARVESDSAGDGFLVGTFNGVYHFDGVSGTPRVVPGTEDLPVVIIETADSGGIVAFVDSTRRHVLLGSIVPLQEITFSSTVRAVTFGDFSGDGRDDLAVAASADGEANTVFVYHYNPAAARFELKQTLSGFPPGNVDLEAWRRAGDGVCLAVASSSFSGVQLLNNSSGTLVMGGSLSTGLRPVRIVVADSNADGRDDLNVFDSVGTAIVHFQNPAGTVPTFGSVVIRQSGSSGDRLDATRVRNPTGDTVAASGAMAANGAVQIRDGSTGAVKYSSFFGPSPFSVFLHVFFGEALPEEPEALATTHTLALIGGTQQLAAGGGFEPMAAHVALIDINLEGDPPADPPDLAPTTLGAPGMAAAGQNITVKDTIANQGTGAAVASRTDIYLSADTVLDESDELLGSRVVPAIVPGASNAGKKVVTIPADTAAGVYHIIIVADGADANAESDEADNTRSKKISIGPNLKVSTLTAPTSATPGSTIAIDDTSANTGAGAAGASTTKFYLSKNGKFDDSDVLLGSRAIPALAGRTSNAGSTSVRIPTDTVPGDYVILGLADAGNAVLETSETDNKKTRKITIVR